MTEAVNNLAVDLDFEDVISENTIEEKVAERAQGEEIEVLKVEEKSAAKPVNKTQLAQTAVTKINQIGRELGMENFEREEEIRSIQLGLATGKHVLLLGPPGTARRYTLN